MDEAGFYLLPAVVRSYAPRGCTPVLHPCVDRDHLSVLSGVTPTGHLYTTVSEQTINGSAVVAFLEHLLGWTMRTTHCNLLVIWDGSPIHRGKEVERFLSAGGAEHIHLESLPGYAPDLNPDEGVWNHLKFTELRNVCCTNLDELRYQLNLAILRLRQKPHLIQSFFSQAMLDL